MRPASSTSIRGSPWIELSSHTRTAITRAGARDITSRSEEGLRVLRTRLGADASIQPVAYGEAVHLNGVRVSLHPAGHILGSAQIRVEHAGEVWVASGDYKADPDPTCSPFEIVRCHTFITESTFGLPIYRWRPQSEVFAEMREWWSANARRRASVDHLRVRTRQSAARARWTASTRTSVRSTRTARWSGSHATIAKRESRCLQHGTRARCRAVTTSAAASSSLRRRRRAARGFAGSAPLRPPLHRAGCRFAARGGGARVDRGFVLSDHVDWPALLATIEATGAEHVWVTHGFREPVVRWLLERGINAISVASHWEGEEEVESPAAGEEIVA